MARRTLVKHELAAGQPLPAFALRLRAGVIPLRGVGVADVLVDALALARPGCCGPTTAPISRGSGGFLDDRAEKGAEGGETQASLVRLCQRFVIRVL